MKRFVFLAILGVLMTPLCSVSYSQTIKFNPKFDAVSEDEVKMTSYAPDTSADAVVIYSGLRISTYLAPQGEFIVEKTHRLRLKILKEVSTILIVCRLIYQCY